MKLKLIKTKKDYNEALQRLARIFDAKQGVSIGDELDLLFWLFDQYEKEHFPVEAIKFRIEPLDMKQINLASTIGFKSRVCEVLNKKGS